MTINDTMNTASATSAVNEQGVLEKDDFLKLLLTELQHQDPTNPMDSDKILTQTSQLATMESAKNTQDALDKLAKSMEQESSFGAVNAIGKMADLGSGEIVLKESGNMDFDLYFQDDIQSGSLYITDADGNVIKTVGLSEQSGGTLNFKWDGTDNAGNSVTAGSYYVHADFTNPAGNSLATRAGTYPISSVKFDEGETLLRLGSNYVNINKVKEIF